MPPLSRGRRPDKLSTMPKSAGRLGRTIWKGCFTEATRHPGRCFRCGYSLPVPFRRTAKGRDWEQDIIIFTNMPMIRPAISRKR